MSGHSQTFADEFGTEEAIILFTKLHTDPLKILEERRYQSIRLLLGTGITPAACQLVIDYTDGKNVIVEDYTCSQEEKECLASVVNILKQYDDVRQKVRQLTFSEAGSIDTVIRGISGENLLGELLPLSDARFCDHIHEHYLKGHFTPGLTGTQISRVLSNHFSDVPDKNTLQAALSHGYVIAKNRRKPRKAVTRRRIDK